MVSTISRVTNRAKRQVIARFTPVNRLVQNAHEAKVRDHRPLLPHLSPEDLELVARQDSQGVQITSLDELGFPGTESIKSSLRGMVDRLAKADLGGDSTVRPTRAELLEELELWQWGLNDRLLRIVENYIGLPVWYYGADVRREVADGKPVGVRQWHRDIEDHKVFKILVWLNDVGPDGGPFEYIPKSATVAAAEQLKYVAGFVTDEAMDKVVPSDKWLKATGPQWTAVMPDTANVFHRAMPPKEQDRYSVTFTWTSRHPVTMIPAQPFTPAELQRIHTGLNDTQLACLPPSLK